MKRRQIVKLRRSGLIIAISLVLGLLYPVMMGIMEAQVFKVSLCVAFLMPTLAMLFEYGYADSRYGAWIRRLPFSWFMVVKLIVYHAIIYAAFGITFYLFIPEARSIAGVFEVGRAILTPREFLLALFVFACFGIGISIAQLMGPRTLRNYLTGRYHRPRKGERIFLFLDMVGSTPIAEQLGDLQYHSFLNRFFIDVSRPVFECGGVVHQYIGDQMIASWPVKRGLRAGQCLRAVVEAQERLEANGPAYERDFGFRPQFRAGLHVGQVVRGEMGEVKREIVFVGNVMNVTARIENACRELDHPILISEDLMRAIQLPEQIGAHDVGEIALRGMENPTRLFAIRREPEARPLSS